MWSCGPACRSEALRAFSSRPYYWSDVQRPASSATDDVRQPRVRALRKGSMSLRIIRNASVRSISAQETGLRCRIVEARLSDLRIDSPSILLSFAEVILLLATDFDFLRVLETIVERSRENLGGERCVVVRTGSKVIDVFGVGQCRVRSGPDSCHIGSGCAER